MRNLDLAVLALALALFAAAGLPVAGWALAAAVWMVQRGIQLAFDRQVEAATEPGKVAGWVVSGFMTRALLVLSGILAGGLALGDEAGLAAALLVLLTFTVHLLSTQAAKGLAAR